MIANMNTSVFALATKLVKIPSPAFRPRWTVSCAALFTLTAAMVLTGCVEHTPPDLAQHLTPHWQHQMNADPLPAPDLYLWWRSFHAPDLDALIDASLQQNLTLAAAAEHIRAARIMAGDEPHKFLPDLHFATDDLPAPSATSSYFRAGLQSTWELGLFGKKAASAQISSGELGGVVAQAQMARVALVAEVVQTWIKLRTAQQQIILLDQMLGHTTLQINLTEVRVKLGLSAQSALAALQTLQSRQMLLRQEKQADVELALEQLALLQGRQAGDPALAIPTTQPVVADLPVASLPADLIRIRPDIQQAAATVIEAAGQLGVAKAQRYPSISIAGSFMYSLQVLGKFRFSNANVHGVGSIGPEIDIPLFDWGQRKAKADAQEAELQAAVYAYRQTVLEAVHEVESAIAVLNAQQQRTLEQHKIITAAQHSLSAQQSLQQLGLVSPLEMLSDQQAVLQAQLELSGDA